MHQFVISPIHIALITVHCYAL